MPPFSCHGFERSAICAAKAATDGKRAAGIADGIRIWYRNHCQKLIFLPSRVNRRDRPEKEFGPVSCTGKPAENASGSGKSASDCAMPINLL